MSRPRSLFWLAFPLGLAIGWPAGAWAWVRWTPFSAVRLARARTELARGDGLWAHAPSPLGSGGTLALRPALETVLASAVIPSAVQRISIPPDINRYLSLQLVDARGVTLAVLAPGAEFAPGASPGSGGPLWCIARARVLPGEGPDVARASIEGIQFARGPED